LTVVFPQAVTISSGVLTSSGVYTTTGAFTLANTGGTLVPVNYSNPSGDDKTWLITFTNSFTAYGSLPNGGYTLTAVQSDLSGAGAPSSNQSFTFARLYGDFFGANTANFSSLVLIAQHYNQATPAGLWYADCYDTGELDFDDLIAIDEDYNQREAAANSGAILMGASATPSAGPIPFGIAPQQFYYSDQWQVLQVSALNAGTGTVQTESQNVWGLAYVNELVLRDSDSTGDASGNLGISGSGLNLRLYALQDANYNVVALANTSGTVVERFDYTPYGTVTVLSASGVQTVDSYGWQIGYQGGWTDSITALVHFQNRYYNPATATWMTQDPMGYVNGANLYQMERSNPMKYIDPRGMMAFKSCFECAKAIEELLAANAVLARRIAEGIDLDAGHEQAINDAAKRVENALTKVEKFCYDYYLAPAAIMAADSLLDLVQQLYQMWQENGEPIPL